MLLLLLCAALLGGPVDVFPVRGRNRKERPAG